MRTQVGIIGAGPAGLLLAQLLAVRGIDSVVLENRSRDYVQARIRAGILEQGTVDVLTGAGVGERLHREGLRHDGIYLQYPGHREHLDFPGLCGRSVWAYGQTEVVKDLIEARLAAGQQIEFEISGTALHDLETNRPRITYADSAGVQQVLECDVVAGCDGFHGPSRPMLPAALQQTWVRDYPFAWLGILADVAPSTDELIYAWHPDGFALHSMRSPSVSRLYLQVDPDERLESWSDDRIWSELQHRMAFEGWQLRTGPITDRSITPMRSFVSAPMRHGRLFLAGDAAHIVPPTGAKGLNLAVADVTVLCEALTELLAHGRGGLADAYSDTALRRVWRATHFSWWMTSMLHASGDDFEAQLQLSQLRYVTSSPSAAQSLAENYTGLPLG
jgi:p-hydroxybenzoate 3-monooxygenase